MRRSCPRCHKPNATLARRCVHCAETLPSPITRAGRALHCAACLAPSHEVLFASIQLDVCERCASVWLDREELKQLPAAFSDEAMRDAARSVLTALRSAPPAEQAPAYPNCPVCHLAMARRTYKQVSGISLHHCKDHGTWADHEAAVALFGVLGAASQRELDARRDAQRDDELNRQMGALRSMERSLRARLQRVETAQRWHVVLDVLDIL